MRMRKIQGQRREGFKSRPRSLAMEKLDERLPLTGFVLVDAADNVVPPPAGPVSLQFEVSGTPANDDIDVFWDAANFQVNYIVKQSGPPVTATAGSVQAGDIFNAAVSFQLAGSVLTGWTGYRSDGGGGDDNMSADGLLFDPVTFFGGPGKDTLVGGSQGDKLDGGAGDDNLDGGLGADRLFGGGGNDTVDADKFDTASDSSGSKDKLTLDDVPYGGVNISNDGFEHVVGSKSGDRVDNTNYSGPGWKGIDDKSPYDGPRTEGGEGDDTVVSSKGRDWIQGGPGSDTASYESSSANVKVSLLTGSTIGGTAQGDRLDSIENLAGSAFDDDLEGDRGANELKGNDGNDELRGLEGEDVLRGGKGNDHLEGGQDNDRLFGGEGKDLLEGDHGDDRLIGDEVQPGKAPFIPEDTDELVGGIGNDYLDGGRFAPDSLDAGPGKDELILYSSEFLTTRDLNLFGGPDGDAFRVVDAGNGVKPPDNGLDPVKVDAVITGLDDMVDANQSDWDPTLDNLVFLPDVLPT